MASLFLLLGITMTLFAHRIAIWLNRASLIIFKVAPWLNFSGKDEDELLDEWAKSKFHIFETIWIWGLRIMGVIFTVGSAFVLFVLIIQS